MEQNTKYTLSKNEKGITLVALVITIIILLILATVSINLVMNNGILDKAKYAVDKYSEGEIEEQIKITYQEWQMQKYTGTDSELKAFMLTRLEGIFGDTVDIKGNEILKININNNGKKYEYALKNNGNIVKYGIEEYNQAGLILQLDGIENTRNGHSTTTTTWEDLSGNNNDFIKHNSASNATWSDNSYVGDAKNRTLELNKAILANSNECTVEVCYDVPQLNNYYWVFQNRKEIGTADGFQFSVGTDGRSVTLFNKKNNSNYNNITTAKGTAVTELGKKTMAFSLDTTNVIFSDNGQFYTQETVEGIINSVMQRNIYSIGSNYPWQNCIYSFKGNIYSIRVYNRKLSEEELKNNYEIDKLRFDM